ncbi:hypothetical protein CANCADRAFT_30519 [Tortispora caseinolytica NRRL Y-17796]|uniref:Isochorismatase-like domain-containing protein n=1 Tax=Tortispora caseinolytica NRRL Y-17796 TaxID=767744 RepID=A0A1E4TKQ3_9ASCO|nr:hypothetical protein CANCADRAFT_30519 [Tortispora caseinolytica NRRL Y-17796]
MATRLFVCDIQQALRQSIYSCETVITQTCKLLDAAEIFGWSVIATTQKKRALGETVPEILEKPAFKRAEINSDKTLFSMMIPEVKEIVQPDDTVIIAGVESHVCVLQTVLDLCRSNIKVYVCADAVSSGNRGEIPIALRRMASAGAIVSTSDSVMFELLKDASHPNFKQMSQLIKTNLSSTGEALLTFSKI